MEIIFGNSNELKQLIIENRTIIKSKSKCSNYIEQETNFIGIFFEQNSIKYEWLGLLFLRSKDTSLRLVNGKEEKQKQNMWWSSN